jgi:putative endonuclease
MGRRGIKLGRLSEDMAERFLKGKGYRILERNYRSVFGELDIIAKDGDCIVFVEVKSSRSPLFGPPSARVGRDKKRHMARCALSYMKRASSVDSICRIDVVSISLDKEKASIELIKDAFRVNI